MARLETWSRAGAFCVIATLVSTLLIPAEAPCANVHWKTKSLLKSFFANSDKVSYAKVELTKSELAALEKRLGYVPKRTSWTIFVGLSAGTVDGYAVIDNELGQHEPITMAALLGPDCSVKRQELMVYREAYGEEISSKRFRNQFVGKGAGDKIAVGRDITAVSGATISSHSAARMVRRAVHLLEVLKETRGSLVDLT